jgi:hypothetical protein
MLQLVLVTLLYKIKTNSLKILHVFKQIVLQAVIMRRESEQNLMCNLLKDKSVVCTK